MLQTTRFSKNLLLLMDVAEGDKIGIVSSGGHYEDETIERLLFMFKN